MRLFVSIDLPDGIQEKLQGWLPSLPGLRYSKMEQLHLTLFFIGESDGDQVSLVTEKLRTVKFDPFQMIIEGVGAFPGRKNPRVIWAGVEKSDELMNLQEQISRVLSGVVDNDGNHSFKPHITLARTTRQFRFKQSDKLFEISESVSFTVASVSLKKSILSREGSTHTVLETFYAGSGHS